MRWFFASVLVLVAGAVAILALVLWRPDADETDDERRTALAYAQQVACAGTGACTDFEGLTQLAPRVWRVRSLRTGACIAINLDQFRVVSGGREYDGVGRVPCPGASGEPEA